MNADGSTFLLSRQRASRVAGLLLTAGCVFLTVAGAQDGALLFEAEIRPVLATRCVSCHGPDRADGEVRLDSREGISTPIAGGLFVDTISGRSTAPASCVLEPRLVEPFVRWIALAMPWPDEKTVVSAGDRETAARRHWSFQVLREPKVPDGKTNPLDAFVEEARARAGLKPSPEADRRTLIRRLSFTLTGLPPAYDEVTRFVNDPDPDAYAKLVDRFLASPQYGEHWARHWLDVARYSDTKGYVYAREEKNWPHAWAYRDWVVTAMNEDLPYDRFLLLQLAADQVTDRRPGDLAAMGFLTIGRRFLGVKHDIIDDRIDVVTRGMLGLTVSCARCHDHKYDPIPAADYYALYGVFDSSIEKLTTLAPGSGEFMAGHEERVKKLNEFMTKSRLEADDRARERLGDYLKAQTELDKYPADGFGQIFQKTDLLPAFVHAWRDYLRRAAEQEDPVFAHWRAYGAATADHYAAVSASIASAHPLIAAAFATPPRDFDEVVTRYATVLQGGGDDPVLRAVTHGPGSPCVVPEGPLVNVETFFHNASITEIWKLENEVARGILNAPEAVPAALTLVDRKLPTEPHILLRGNPLTQGEVVPRQFLKILAGGKRSPFTTGSGRLELAEAIADPKNPLTARVIVNRVWAQHFGTGLVDTPSDFGTRAAPPSHPALLDWLALNFIRDGWSLKALQRRILLSSTYRQSSSGPGNIDHERAIALDPGNRLLWRMRPHRLGYEEFRDSMMAAARELDLTAGGRPVEAFRVPYMKRRALYGKVDRQFVPGVLRIFDFANPDLHIPQRSETTVPQQALFFINDPFVLDRTRAVATASAGLSAPPDRVRALFRLTLQRDPSADEMAESLALVAAANHPDPAPLAPAAAADWTYGYGAIDEKAQRVSTFTALPHFSAGAWQGGPAVPDPKLGWVYLNATGGHPGNDKNHAAIRRWTAPRAMTLAIHSKLTHEPKVGDGIRGFVVSSRVGLLGSAALHASSSELNLATLAVEAGETIDFLVDRGEGLNSDQFLWEISLTDSAPDLENPAGPWHAKSDFPADFTLLLTAWEQLTQALLCSNEFLFVD